MATITDSVTSEKRIPEQSEALSLVESGALKALTSIGFSTEDKKLHPPICKQHIWQQILVQAVTQAVRFLKDFPNLKLMHSLVSYTPMESITFSMERNLQKHSVQQGGASVFTQATIGELFVQCTLGGSARSSSYGGHRHTAGRHTEGYS
jgi:hypothetical protein